MRRVNALEHNNYLSQLGLPSSKELSDEARGVPPRVGPCSGMDERAMRQLDGQKEDVE